MAVDPSAVDIVRRFYDPIADGDLASAAECFDTHAVWVLPGRSAIAGEHRGWAAIRDNFLTKLAPLSRGTFSVDLAEVATGQEHVIAVQHATANHRRRLLDITACQLINVGNGKIVHVRVTTPTNTH